ncbi:hypothetical protein PCANC_13553 [Puccinia coronata f. sp. avenae]|uniref:Uncharacterized protein n=1 Tax=Puccinia coronata f. sp. avenae TaxID=200324 RepID=A0A2N5UCN9_9BASI|nr:hypothetical protein PCASD_11228 [Puccinia coronata f. sp. avenae]PLW35499.1 hypothetical protein PCANC_13553 [Puccinia coronata f. sp. avenae]
MLQLVTLEKLWLLLATVTVGILAIVDIAETSGQEKIVVGRSKLGSNELHRRAPPSPGISIQCGDSINVPNSQAKMPPKSVACMGWSHRPMACRGPCYIRSTPSFRTPGNKPINWWDFSYNDCTKVGGSKAPVTIRNPFQVWARPNENALYVVGQHGISLWPDVGLYKCMWQSKDFASADNYQRPWCDGCEDFDFEEAPIPFHHK